MLITPVFSPHAPVRIAVHDGLEIVVCPAMLDAAAPVPPLDTLPGDLRAVLMGLAMDLGGARFVPGLYRQMAPWPAYLAHAATVIAPLLHDESARARRAGIARTMIDAAAGIVAALPPAPPELTPPGAASRVGVGQRQHSPRE